MLWQYFSIFQWLLVVQYQTNIYLCVFWGLTSFNYLIFFCFAVHIWFLWTFFTKRSFCLLILVLSLHCFCCSVAQLCPTLYHPMDCSMLGPPWPSLSPWVCSNWWPLSWWCHPSNHLILCRPLLVLPSVFLSIRVFSNESALCIRWPKY